MPHDTVPFINPAVVWLLSVINIPMLLGAGLMIIRFYKDVETRFATQQKNHDVMVADIERRLTDIKLAIANDYARISAVQDIERRVVSHLLRIESKLDVTALKAEALHYHQRAAVKPSSE